MHYLKFGGHLDLPFAGFAIGGYHIGRCLLDGPEEGFTDLLRGAIILSLEAIRAGDAAACGGQYP